MRRTEVLQEIRKMRFEEAYGGWQAGRLTQEEAARLLGVCDRTFHRYIDRYEEEGLEWLIDKRLTQVSQRRAPLDEVMALLDFASRSHSTADALEAFFVARGAVQSFDWTLPHGAPGKWVARDWTVQQTGPFTRTVQATFDEAPA